MMHQTGLNDETIKQVEINTIAAGFGYVGTKMSLLHRYIEFLFWINQKFPNSAKYWNKKFWNLTLGK